MMRGSTNDHYLDQNYPNPSKNKIPKTCITTSKSRQYRSPLKQISQANSIAFSKQKSVDVLEKCKLQLSKRNQMLIKKIEEKQQKIEQLRDKFRRIQRSQSKDVQKSKERVRQQISAMNHKSKASHQDTPQTRPSTSLLSSDFMSKFKLFSPTS